MYSRYWHILLIVMSCVLLISCSKQDQEDVAWQKERDDIFNDVLQMIDKHDVNCNWQDAMLCSGYTVDFQATLLEPQGGKYFLLSSVEDIYKKNGEYYMYTWSCGVCYVFVCDRGQVEYVKSCKEGRWLIDCAMVFSPSSVRKVFELEQETDIEYISESDTDGYNNVIIIPDLADRMIVFGKLIDIVYAGDYCFGIEDKLRSHFSEKVSGNLVHNE